MGNDWPSSVCGADGYGDECIVAPGVSIGGAEGKFMIAAGPGCGVIGAVEAVVSDWLEGTVSGIG